MKIYGDDGVARKVPTTFNLKGKSYNYVGGNSKEKTYTTTQEVRSQNTGRVIDTKQVYVNDKKTIKKLDSMRANEWKKVLNGGTTKKKKSNRNSGK